MASIFDELDEQEQELNKDNEWLRVLEEEGGTPQPNPIKRKVKPIYYNAHQRKAVGG